METCHIGLKGDLLALQDNGHANFSKSEWQANRASCIFLEHFLPPSIIAQLLKLHSQISGGGLLATFWPLTIGMLSPSACGFFFVMLTTGADTRWRYLPPSRSFQAESIIPRQLVLGLAEISHGVIKDTFASSPPM